MIDIIVTFIASTILRKSSMLISLILRRLPFVAKPDFRKRKFKVVSKLLTYIGFAEVAEVQKQPFRFHQCKPPKLVDIARGGLRRLGVRKFPPYPPIPARGMRACGPPPRGYFVCNLK